MKRRASWDSLQVKKGCSSYVENRETYQSESEFLPVAMISMEIWVFWPKSGQWSFLEASYVRLERWRKSTSRKNSIAQGGG